MRLALGVEYDGSAFCGWQTQPNGHAVQDVLQKALSHIAASPITVVCAGRTDAGVHATEQVLHFDTEIERPLTAWVRGVNTFLPPHVAVRWSHPVTSDFHARFSAQARHYRYLLLNRMQRPGLWQSRAGWYHHPLDADKMQEAAHHLLGERDFSAFRAAECQAHSPVRTLHSARVRRHGEWIIFDFMANAFLHHMVRNMVGSLVYIGQGKHAPDWIGELLQHKDRRYAAPTFAAAGLYLVQVDYAAEWNLPHASIHDALLF